MAPPTRKQLAKGSYGHADPAEDADFLRIERDPWEASASGEGYKARYDDDSGVSRGQECGYSNTSDDEAFLRPSQDRTDESSETIHGRLFKLIDHEVDHGSGNKLTGGGGPVSDNVPARDSGGGWGGSDRKGPRYAPKTGPQGNMRKPR